MASGFADHLATLRDALITSRQVAAWRGKGRSVDECDAALAALNALAAGVWLEREEAVLMVEAIRDPRSDSRIKERAEGILAARLGHESDTG